MPSNGSACHTEGMNQDAEPAFEGLCFWGGPLQLRGRMVNEAIMNGAVLLHAVSPCGALPVGFRVGAAAHPSWLLLDL